MEVVDTVRIPDGLKPGDCEWYWSPMTPESPSSHD
jgi:hypothetical protein